MKIIAKDKKGNIINICRICFDSETKEDYAIMDWDEKLYLKSKNQYIIENEDNISNTGE